MNRTLLSAIFFGMLLSSCGVKAPPLPPERDTSMMSPSPSPSPSPAPPAPTAVPQQKPAKIKNRTK